MTKTYFLLILAENPKDELSYEDLVKLRVVRKRIVTFAMLSGIAAGWKMKVFINHKLQETCSVISLFLLSFKH